jgi:hypothetical protein
MLFEEGDASRLVKIDLTGNEVLASLYEVKQAAT